MCTAFVNKGQDILFGYNLDIDPAEWKWSLIREKSLFSVGIKIKSALYYTHGVNSKGNFACLPYMNGENPNSVTGGKNQYRIDLLCDRYISGRFSFGELDGIVRTKKTTNAKNACLHSLIADGNGRAIIIEPTFGWREASEKYTVLTNFPVIPELSDYSNPFYGKDRYDFVTSVLQGASEDFSVLDGMKLLEKVSTDGQWGTRLSFVYSRNENAVYYCLDRDFDNIEKWQFEIRK